MSKLGMAALTIVLATLVFAARGYAGFGTTVPVSAETATNVARSVFPVSMTLGAGNLLLTDPVVIFIDNRRMGLEANFQAYDHRPQEGVAISEEGRVVVSGEVGYDPGTRQILLYSSRIESLHFNSESEATKRLRAEVEGAWASRVSNPIRADLPPHPLIAAFRDGIQGVTYEDHSIYIQVWYP